jgi:hypothetical protein
LEIKLAQMRGLKADFEDAKSITLRRSKIEQWVNELFFEDAIIGSLVRVGFNRRYLVAEVKGVGEEEDQEYSLTNGKVTSKVLRLQLSEDKTEKVKGFKIS